MPPKTFIVSTYESNEFGREAQPKLPETFAKDVDDELAQIEKIGGKILSVCVVDLKVLLSSPEGSDAKVKGYGKQSSSDREPRNHLVIIADVPIVSE